MAQEVTLTASMRANLISLQNTEVLLNRTQERLATGKKVNSALDNPLNYFAASAHMQRASDLTERKDGMGEAIQTIKAGATITSSTPVTWDRTRSSVDTCAATDRQRAPGGGAAYRLTVSIGGFQSTNPMQFLLN